MKKSIIIGLLLITPQQIISENHNGPSDADFDKFLQELFGPPDAPKKVKPSPPIKEDAVAAKAEKEKKLVEKVEKEEKEEIRQKVLLDLRELKRLLESITNATQSNIFTPQFREMIKKYIQQGEPIPVTPETTMENNADETPLASYKNQGAYGLIALLGKILSKKVYRQALAEEKYEDLREELHDLANKLSDLNHDIDNFKDSITVVTEEKILKEYLRPQKERKIQPLTPAQQKEQIELQNRLTNLYKKLPNFTKQLEEILTDPEVTKQIEKKIKTREELEREAQRKSKYYSSPYNGRRWFDDGGRWAPGGYTPPFDSDGQGFFDGNQDRADYTEPSRNDFEKEPTELKDDKKKGIGWKRPREKKETVEDKLKTNLISLIKQATTLLKDICSPIKPTTTITDESIESILETNHYKIKELAETIKQIENQKNTPQAQKEKKQTEWKQAEQAYHSAFVQYLNPLILLGKYGYIQQGKEPDTQEKKLKTLVETPAGRYQVILPTTPQNEIRTIYQLMTKALPQPLKKKVIEEETKIKQTIIAQIKNQLATHFIGLNTAFDPNQTLLDLGITTETSLELLKINLFAILQSVLAAKNNPLTISIKSTDLEITQPKLNRIKEVFALVQGKFSPFLQKNIFNVQKHETVTKSHFEQLEEKIKRIITTKKLVKKPIDLIKGGTTDGAFPDVANTELRELFSENVSIAGKTYSYRKIARYHLMAAALNELDQCIQLINEIKKQTQTKWSIPAIQKNPDIEIVDAILANRFNLADDTVESIEDPQSSNVITTALINYVQNNIATQTIRGLPNNILKASYLFQQFFSTRKRIPHGREFLIICNIKINGTKEKKAFIVTQREREYNIVIPPKE